MKPHRRPLQPAPRPPKRRPRVGWLVLLLAVVVQLTVIVYVIVLLVSFTGP
jgi:hypothetical protein